MCLERALVRAGFAALTPSGKDGIYEVVLVAMHGVVCGTRVAAGASPAAKGIAGASDRSPMELGGAGLWPFSIVDACRTAKRMEQTGP